MPIAVNALVRIDTIDVDVLEEFPMTMTPAIAPPKMARSPTITAKSPVQDRVVWMTVSSPEVALSAGGGLAGGGPAGGGVAVSAITLSCQEEVSYSKSAM